MRLRLVLAAIVAVFAFAPDLGQPTQPRPGRRKQPEKAKPGADKPAERAGGVKALDGDYAGARIWTHHLKGRDDIHGRTKIAFSSEGGAISGPAGLRGRVAASGRAQGTFTLKGYDCVFNRVAFNREAGTVTGPFACKIKGLVNTITGRIEARQKAQ